MAGKAAKLQGRDAGLPYSPRGTACVRVGALRFPRRARDDVFEEDSMPIFTHVTVGTNNLQRARDFYDKVLAPLGYKRLNDLGDNGSIWGESAPEFFVLKPANGQPATFANGGTISFVAPSRAAVAEFHRAALAAGGEDGRGVGPRSWHPDAQARYVPGSDR